MLCKMGFRMCYLREGGRMRRVWIGALAGLAVAGAAAAHQGAMGVVKERMDGMGVMKAAVKSLGQMARGQASFDAENAALAFAQIATAGRLVPTQFEARDLSAPSEALATIWERWDDFVAKSEAMVRAAEIAPTDLETLRAGLGAVGQTCMACHQVYRKAQ